MFCQPFLISATLTFISSPSNPESHFDGPALVEAYVLTYLGIAEREFDTQTVIAVIHRLRHVEQFDKVVLMKQERMVEFDSSQALLTRPTEFRSFYHARQTN